MSERSDTTVVGFDLGHGETAVAWAHARKTNPPSVIALTGASGTGKQQVTAVAVHPERGVLIGEEAVFARGTSELHLAFKHPEVERVEVRTPVEMFASKIKDDVLERSPVPADRSVRWVVGVPSGWNDDRTSAYAAVLRQAGLTKVDVIPESRAALLYARDSGELDARTVRGMVAGAVLIVDMGSSTADFTFVSGYKMRPVDTGTTLGAHLIDKTIRDRVIAAHPQRDELEELLQTDRDQRLRLELVCRQTKEMYFRVDPRRFAAYPDETVVHTHNVPLRAGGRIRFMVELSADDMREVLDTPQPALDGRSWRQAFRDDLVAAAEAVGEKPGLVLFTGGASRMHFVLEIAREVFSPDAVMLGVEPEFAIARGLALAGRTSVRAAGFRADVRRLIEGDRIEAVVNERLHDFGQALGDAAAAGMTERYVVPAFRRWRNAEITTLNDMAAAIAAELHKDLTDPNNPQIAKAAADWQNSLRPELEELTRPICNRWHIPPGAMELPPTRVQASDGSVTITTDLTHGTDVLNGVATAINVVVAAVIATTLFGAGTAIIGTTGPVGVAVAFVALMIGLAIGKDAAMEKAKTYNLPLALRQLRSEEKLLVKLRANATAEEAALSRRLAEQFLADGGPRLVTEISAGIAVQLDLLAADAELLVS